MLTAVQRAEILGLTADSDLDSSTVTDEDIWYGFLLRFSAPARRPEGSEAEPVRAARDHGLPPPGCLCRAGAPSTKADRDSSSSPRRVRSLHGLNSGSSTISGTGYFVANGEADGVPAMVAEALDQRVSHSCSPRCAVDAADLSREVKSDPLVANRSIIAARISGSSTEVSSGP